MTRTLTLARLEARNACRPQLEEFKRRFGAGGEVTLEKCLSVAQVFDWAWAARYLLPPAAKRARNEAMAAADHAYDEAKAPAWRAYDEALAAADHAYDEAKAAAWRAYDEAKAAADHAYDEAEDLARRAYNEAIAAADHAYNEAMAPAKRAYNEAMAPVWRAYNEAMATTFFHAWSADND
jgi:hypothetical protein